MKTSVNLLLSLFLCTPILSTQQSEVILFISDTQQPLWIETLRLREHDTEKMTQHLFSFIAKETTASALYFERQSEDERDRQNRWNRQTLASFKNDSTVKSIIVACYHSLPLTTTYIIEPS